MEAPRGIACGQRPCTDLRLLRSKARAIPRSHRPPAIAPGNIALAIGRSQDSV